MLEFFAGSVIISRTSPLSSTGSFTLLSTDYFSYFIQTKLNISRFSPLPCKAKDLLTLDKVPLLQSPAHFLTPSFEPSPYLLSATMLEFSGLRMLFHAVAQEAERQLLVDTAAPYRQVCVWMAPGTRAGLPEVPEQPPWFTISLLTAGK